MPVTKANYADAETQTVFAKYIAKVAAETCTGGLGTIWNDGETADPTDRTVIRINFDTLYSLLIVDLTTPATYMLPQTNGRYQSAMVVNGQRYVYVEKEPGGYTLTQDEVGNRFALVAFRTGVNIQDPEDVAQAQALQAKLTVNQADTGEFVKPNRFSVASAKSPQSKTTWELPLASVACPRRVLSICSIHPHPLSLRR